MNILKNPIVSTVLTVLAVIAVLKIAKAQISAIPVAGPYLTLN
jgi:hypothetical protein